MFLERTQHIPERMLPKRHLTTHLLARVDFQGNPRLYANWQDESVNKTLKLACRTMSQTTFEPMLFLRMRHLLPMLGRGVKRPGP